MNGFLYSASAVIWGSTWLAISLQSGKVPVLTSIFYRFLLASFCMIAIGAGRGLLKRLRGPDLFFTVLQGFCLYSFNYICFYNGVKYITGGMESLIFSTAIFFNCINSRLIYKESPPRNFFLSAVTGMAGLVLILFEELSLSGQDSWKGILFCLGGTMFFSLGNMIGKRQHEHGITPVQSNAYAMVWGTITLSLLMVFTGSSFSIPLRFSYLTPLLYLALPGSVIAFTAYLTLVNRIGAQRASFITVVSPLIAMTLAVLFEGETLTALNISGGVFILTANRMISIKNKKLRLCRI